jgi:hypothetical protein
MLVDEIVENISKIKSTVCFESIETPKLPKFYSKLLPNTKFNFNISRARYVSKCLELTINDESYLLIEANVLYRRKVNVNDVSTSQKILGFTLNKTICSTDEEQILNELEDIKKEFATFKLSVVYKKHFSTITNSLFYYFSLRTYFIVKDTKIEEVSFHEFKSIRTAHRKMTFELKKKMLKDKMRMLDKTILLNCI